MEELRWHRRMRYPPSLSQCRIPTCILKESSHRHRMKLRHQEQKSLPPLLKMEQMRLQVEICVLPWRIRMQDTTNALAQVENAVSAEAVNLTLDQIVSKGDGTNWENPVTQFEPACKNETTSG